MLILSPDYYDSFKCTADRCPDTCCANWVIVVDGSSADRYRKTGGKFGERLISAMSVDKDGDIVFNNINGKCPFLNDRLLCDIYTELGEQALCGTCKKFPRFTNVYGGVEERGLSLSCPEAARLIIENNFELSEDYDDREPDINELDAELYFLLKKERKSILSFISGGITREKLYGLLRYGRCLEAYTRGGFKDLPMLREDHCGDLSEKPFEKFEYLTAEGKSALRKTSFDNASFTHEHINIFKYYIYRYFLASVYDSDVFFPILLAVFGVMTIASLPYPARESAVLFSKEIEHSENNLRILKDFAKNNIRD